MKKFIFFSLLLCCGLLFQTCKKDSGENAKVCYLTKYTQTYNGNSMTYTYLYDSDNHVIRTNEDDGTGQNFYTVYEYLNGKLIKKNDMQDSRIAGYTAYNYGSNGKISETDSYIGNLPGNPDPFSLPTKVMYEYNAGGQLVKNTGYKDSSYVSYTYDSKGNQILLTLRDKNNVTMETIEMEYDDRKNPYFSDPVLSNTQAPVNNLIRSVTKGKNGTNALAQTFTFKYGPNGYPENRTENITSGNGTYSSNSTYAFNCQ
jgi:hypothetical protein